jgi:hypothetical protein
MILYFPIELVRYILRFHEEWLLFGRDHHLRFVPLQKLLRIPRPFQRVLDVYERSAGFYFLFCVKLQAPNRFTRYILHFYMGYVKKQHFCLELASPRSAFYFDYVK